MTDVVEVMDYPEPVLEITGHIGEVVLLHGDTLATVEIDQGYVQVVEVVTPGPQGPPGVVGPQGEPGPSETFEQIFANAAMQWTIIHPLGGYPEVTTVDLNGTEIIGDVRWPDHLTVVVEFGMPVAGTARLKA